MSKIPKNHWPRITQTFLFIPGFWLFSQWFPVNKLLQAHIVHHTSPIILLHHCTQHGQQKSRTCPWGTKKYISPCRNYIFFPLSQEDSMDSHATAASTMEKVDSLSCCRLIQTLWRRSAATCAVFSTPGRPRSLVIKSSTALQPCIRSGWGEAPFKSFALPCYARKFSWPMKARMISAHLILGILGIWWILSWPGGSSRTLPAQTLRPLEEGGFPSCPATGRNCLCNLQGCWPRNWLELDNSREIVRNLRT